MMKKTILTFATIILVATSAFSQDNQVRKNTSEETITTKTVVNDGKTKKTMVTEEVKQEKQVITINKTNAENQNEVYSKEENVVVKGVKKVETNDQNQAAVKELKKAEKTEIKDYKKKQDAKNDELRKELKQKEEDRVKEKKKKDSKINN